MKVFTLLGIGLLCLYGTLTAQNAKYAPIFNQTDIFVDANAWSGGMPNFNAKVQLTDKIGLCAGTAYGFQSELLDGGNFTFEQQHSRFATNLMLFPFGAPRQLSSNYKYRGKPAYIKYSMTKGRKYGCRAFGASKGLHFLKGAYLAPGYEWDLPRFNLIPNEDLHTGKDEYVFKVKNNGFVIDIGYMLRFRQLTLGLSYGTKISTPEVTEGNPEYIYDTIETETYPVSHRKEYRAKFSIGFNF